MPNMYEDNYFTCYSSMEYDSMRAEQTRFEQETTWEKDVLSRSMTVTHLDTPIETMSKANDPASTIPPEILMDTAMGTSLLLHYDGKEMCIRECAIPSLRNTAGENGPGFHRLDPEHQACGLSAYLTGSRERSQIMIRAGKVSAVLSSRYQHMPISSLLDICDDLQDTFGDAEFMGGSISHSMTEAKFRYPCSAQEMTKIYSNALAAAGRSSGTIVPVVQFRSSDTACDAATLLPYLQLAPGHLIPIGEGVHVTHTAPSEKDAKGNRISCLEKFQREAATLFSKMEYNISTLLPKMLAVTIKYPRNAFIGLCKYAGVPQKWGGLIEEEVAADWPNESGCTFLDLFEYLAQSTAYAIKDGLSPHSERMLSLEEGIYKVSKNQHKWKEYDLPGTVSWS